MNSHEPSKILIVDDEPGLLFSLCAYLEDDGFIVKTTISGEDALEALAKEHFDAVIIDIRLPGKDGNDVIFEAVKAGTSAAFFIHTGSTDYQIPQSLKQLGFSSENIFLKPILDLDSFCKTLRLRLKKTAFSKKNA
ncbi:MAG: response regulator [Desulfopila sp.]|jgi:DNA-binding NtrC family response regulator|nr:response regulator [Desulfopila sp.]